MKLRKKKWFSRLSFIKRGWTRSVILYAYRLAVVFFFVLPCLVGFGYTLLFLLGAPFGEWTGINILAKPLRFYLHVSQSEDAWKPPDASATRSTPFFEVTYKTLTANPPDNVSSSHHYNASQPIYISHRRVSCRVGDSGPPVTRPHVPSFIIIGTHKGGTTALAQILQHHPYLLRSRRVEAHFFDGFVFKSSGSDSNSDAILAQLRYNASYRCLTQRYYSVMFGFAKKRLDIRQRILESNKFNDSNTSAYPNNTFPVWTFEKTPAYMMNSRIPEALHLLSPQTKIIISLREPISRLSSAFSEPKQTATNQARTFEDSIQQNVFEMKHNLNLTNAPTLQEYLQRRVAMATAVEYDTNFSQYYRNTASSLARSKGSYIDKFGFDFSIPANLSQQHRNRIEMLMHNGVLRGLYAQQLQNWLPFFPLCVNSSRFSKDSQLMIIDFDYFQSNQLQVIYDILDFVGIPRQTVNDNDSGRQIPTWINISSLYKDYSPRRKGDKGVLSRHVIEYLQKFYQPYNDELFKLLGYRWIKNWTYFD